MSALVWGSGDFSGGVATRRSGQLEVLALSALSGIGMLGLCAWLSHEGMPAPSGVAWAAGAGLAGAVGLSCLYRGLADGNAATVAPTAAVVTAALPAVFSALTVGLPRPLQVAGFVVAAAGIWLVARTPGGRGAAASGLMLALAAGVGFGGFLVLIAQVDAALVFTPLAV